MVALKVADVPLECLYKLTDRDGGQGFTKFYRFKNVKLLDEQGKEEKKLSAMENLGLSPLPNGTVRLFSEYKSKDLAYVGGTETKYVPIGDRVEVNVGPDKDITIHRRLKDQKTANVVVRQYKRRLDDQFVLYYDLVDYDETFFYEEEMVSGKPVVAKTEVERQFDANVVLWGPDGKPKDWDSQEPGAYVDLHDVPGRVERVDQQHVKYFLDLQPGKKQIVGYSVTYKRRKVGPELNQAKRGSRCRVWRMVSNSCSYPGWVPMVANGNRSRRLFQTYWYHRGSCRSQGNAAPLCRAACGNDTSFEAHCAWRLLVRRHGGVGNGQAFAAEVRDLDW